MTWVTANAFPVLIFIAFIAMHLFGHGGHGGHAGHGGQSGHDEGKPHRPPDDGTTDDAQRRDENMRSGRHQH